VRFRNASRPGAVSCHCTDEPSIAGTHTAADSLSFLSGSVRASHSEGSSTVTSCHLHNARRGRRTTCTPTTRASGHILGRRTASPSRARRYALLAAHSRAYERLRSCAQPGWYSQRVARIQWERAWRRPCEVIGDLSAIAIERGPRSVSAVVHRTGTSAGRVEKAQRTSMRRCKHARFETRSVDRRRGSRHQSPGLVAQSGFALEALRGRDAAQLDGSWLPRPRILDAASRLSDAVLQSEARTPVLGLARCGPAHVTSAYPPGRRLADLVLVRHSVRAPGRHARVPSEAARCRALGFTHRGPPFPRSSRPFCGSCSSAYRPVRKGSACACKRGFARPRVARAPIPGRYRCCCALAPAALPRRNPNVSRHPLVAHGPVWRGNTTRRMPEFLPLWRRCSAGAPSGRRAWGGACRPSSPTRPGVLRCSRTSRDGIRLGKPNRANPPRTATRNVRRFVRPSSAWARRRSRRHGGRPVALRARSCASSPRLSPGRRLIDGACQATLCSDHAASVRASVGSGCLRSDALTTNEWRPRYFGSRVRVPGDRGPTRSSMRSPNGCPHCSSASSSTRSPGVAPHGGARSVFPIALWYTDCFAPKCRSGSALLATSTVLHDGRGLVAAYHALSAPSVLCEVVPLPRFRSPRRSRRAIEATWPFWGHGVHAAPPG